MSKDNGEREFGRRQYVQSTAALGALGTVALSGCLTADDDGDGGDGGDGGGDGGDGGGDGDGDGGSIGPVEVMHGWTGGDGADAIDNLVGAFEEENPDVEHDIRAIGGEGNVPLDQAVSQRLRDGDPPGSFAGWPGKNLVQYEGALGDVEEEVWNDGDLKDTHAQEVVEACNGPDGFSAVPIGSHRMNDLFYNVEVIDDAGVDPSGIDSFDAWVDALDTVATETDATPYANTLQTWTTLQFWAVIMQGTEGFQAYMDFIEGNGDRDAVLGAFEKAETVLSEYLNNDAAEVGFTEANQRIMAGDAAFIHQGNWVAGAYVTEDLTFGEDWDRIQFPGTEDMYGLHFDSFIYPGDNPTPEASQAWLRFAGTEKAQIAFNKFKGSVPTRETATDEFSPYLTETIEDFNNASNRPPTIAHGLAVTQDLASELNDALSNHFSDPFDAEAVTDQFMDIV